MPLHFTGLVTRRSFTHPEEGYREVPNLPVVPFERVLKFNPHHDPATGKFSSGGKGGGAEAKFTGRTPGKSFSEHQAAGLTNPVKVSEYAQTGPKPMATPEGALDVAQRMKDIRNAFAAQKPGEILSIGPSGVSLNTGPKTDPIGTIHYSDQSLTPTGKKGIPPSHEPVGTIYGSDGQTLIPHENGYIDKDTGQIYQSDAADRKAQAVRQVAIDAAKGAAYVAAYGKKKKR